MSASNLSGALGSPMKPEFRPFPGDSFVPLQLIRTESDAGQRGQPGIYLIRLCNRLVGARRGPGRKFKMSRIDAIFRPSLPAAPTGQSRWLW